MKSYLSLAWKQLKAEKITSLLILSALILSTITATAAGASIGILQSMRVRQAEGLNGNRYATFHQLTEEQMLRLSEDSRLTDVGSILQLGNTRLGSSKMCIRDSLTPTPSCWTDWARIWARATSLCSTAWKAWIILL